MYPIPWTRYLDQLKYGFYANAWLDAVDRAERVASEPERATPEELSGACSPESLLKNGTLSTNAEDGAGNQSISPARFDERIGAVTTGHGELLLDVEGTALVAWRHAREGRMAGGSSGGSYPFGLGADRLPLGIRQGRPRGQGRPQGCAGTDHRHQALHAQLRAEGVCAWQGELEGVSRVWRAAVSAQRRAGARGWLSS